MNGRVLTALLITAVPLLACAGPTDTPGPGPQRGPQTTTIQITYDDLLNQNNIRRDVTISVGDFLQVSLGSNASTGYRWSEQMQISDPDVLMQTGHEAIAPRTAMPGAAGSEVWMLQAMGPGRSTVSTTYGRPWPGGEQDTWTFTADVTVK